MPQETTKHCPTCGNCHLVCIGTQRIKMCANCGNHEIPWFLAPGQKSPLTGQVGGQEVSCSALTDPGGSHATQTHH